MDWLLQGHGEAGCVSGWTVIVDGLSSVEVCRWSSGMDVAAVPKVKPVMKLSRR